MVGMGWLTKLMNTFRRLVSRVILCSTIFDSIMHQSVVTKNAEPPSCSLIFSINFPFCMLFQYFSVFTKSSII